MSSLVIILFGKELGYGHGHVAEKVLCQMELEEELQFEKDVNSRFPLMKADKTSMELEDPELL